MIEPSISIRLANDRPSDSDAFETHKPIAETIIEIIRTNNGGKTIGLEGDWGSGKSTVIKFLSDIIRGAENLSPIDDYEIFVFDSWEHQGDPLRLSFLLTLLAYFSEAEKSKKWVEKSRIRELELELVNKQTKTEAKVALPTAVAGVLLLLIGVFSATLGGLPDSLKDLFWLWILFPFGLIVILIIVIVHYKEALGSFVNSPPPTITTSDDDKTSVEFKKFFKKFMQEALPDHAAKKNRRLIIVVDNLDRISKDDALSIWSTLRTYLEYSEHSSDDQDWSWRERLWTIIPYSYEGIKYLWEDKTENIENQRRMLVKTSRSNSSDNNMSLAHNFLDKTFDLKICVPPIVSTKWKHYFRELMNEIFLSRVPEEELYYIETIFEIFADCYLNTYPTPRSIKLFINELAAHYVSWNFERTKVSLPQVAYFILAKRYEGGISELIKKLRNCDGDHPPLIDRRIPLLIKVSIKDFCTDIAALAFHTNRQTAMELLIGRDISLAFNYRSSATFESSITLLNGIKHNPAFWHVLNKNVTHALRDNDDKNGLFYAARCIREAELLSLPLKTVADEQYKKLLLQVLEEKLLQLNYDDFGVDHVKGLVDLIVITALSEELRNRIINELLTYKVIGGEGKSNG